MRFDGEVNLIGANGGLMLKMSIADGTPTAWQVERAGFGLPSNPTLFAEAIQLHRPDTECSAVPSISQTVRHCRTALRFLISV
jgi:hypothetical protein